MAAKSGVTTISASPSLQAFTWINEMALHAKSGRIQMSIRCFPLPDLCALCLFRVGSAMLGAGYRKRWIGSTGVLMCAVSYPQGFAPIALAHRENGERGRA